MLAVNHFAHQPQLTNPNLFSHIESKPWFILTENHERVNYQFDSIAEFFGKDDVNHDGVGFTFDSMSKLQPGDKITIGIPLPESVHPFEAEVVTSRARGELYESGIWLRITSDSDLLTILRSCDYLNIRHTS